MLSRRSKNTGKKVAVSAMIAGVVGYVTGILTAPKSGKQTRHDIAEGTEDLKEDAEAQLKKANAELKDLISEGKTKSVALGAHAREEFNEAMIRAKDAQTKAAAVLKAVKAGGADDPELNKAVKQANLARKNLAKFLKS